MTTPIFGERAFNPKLEGIRTEELVLELIDRKQAHVAQLEAVVALFSRGAAALPLANGAAPARPIPALPPAPKARLAKAPAAPPDGTSLNERIIGVLAATGGKPLRTTEITDALLQTGWTTASPTPAKMVASAVSVLLKKRVLQRRGERVSLKPARGGPAKTSAKTKREDER